MNNVPINLLRLDGGTQARAAINDAVIQEYREAMEAGAVFPPVVAFFDGTEHWVGDGFHRVLAARACGREEISVEVHEGSRKDALWHGCAANQTHGLRRSNADKRRAVELALQHPRSTGLSDRLVAEHCGVTHPFVAAVRRQLVTVTSAPGTGRATCRQVTHVWFSLGASFVVRQG